MDGGPLPYLHKRNVQAHTSRCADNLKDHVMAQKCAHERVKLLCMMTSWIMQERPLYRGRCRREANLE